MTLKLTSSVNPSLQGESVIFATTISAIDGVPSGPIDIYDAATLLTTLTPDAHGVATYTTSSLALGLHPMQATYHGDATHYWGQANLTQSVVAGYSTATVLTSSLNPANKSQSVTFTATVTSAGGTPAGSVTFADGSTKLATQTLTNGIAQFTTNSLSAGSHVITATYQPSGSFAGSTASLSQQIIGLPSATSLSASPNPAYALQSVTLTAAVTAVSGVPTGTVTFLDGGTTMGTASLNTTGTAAIVVHFNAAGNHSVTAVYSGDATFNTSTSSSLTENVLINPSSTTLSAPTTPVFALQSTGLLATVQSPDVAKYALAGSPSGSVTFFDGPMSLGSSALSNGTSSLNTSSLTAGAHSLTAVYSGDAAFTASTSQPFTLLVLPDKTTTTLNVSPNPAPVGTNVTFQAIVAVSGILPTGTVTFFDGGAALGQSTLDSKGSATLSTSTLSVGRHLISASYAGNVNLVSSTSSAMEVTITPFVGDFAVGVDPSSAASTPPSPQPSG